MLTITVLSFKDAAVEQTIGASFTQAGGTIGRSPESTLLLPDPDRVISRTHAVIAFRDGRYWIRDQGTTVALLVNGRQAGRGQDHPLAAGDELRIAGYLLQVAATDAAPGHDLSDEDTTTILRQGTLLSWSEDGQRVAQNRITTVIVPAPAHEEPSPPGPPKAATAAPAKSPASVAATANPVSNTGRSAPDTDALLVALLSGAGLHDLAVPGGLTPQFMEEVGAVMRETLRGLLDLLAARAQAKREVRADATIIVAQDNNPLKFAPDLDAAVALLLTPPAQGFMTPLSSIADARASLRSHQEGFVAGMRAALAAVLARFDPARLEQRLQESESGGSLLPTSHKAKLWNLYEELYGEISSDAETDFHFLFGEEFLRAYHAKARLPEPRARNNDVA